MKRPPTLTAAALVLTLLGAAIPSSAQRAPTTPKTAAATFQNPVLNEDFPDPFILTVGKTYYAYGTNSGGVDVPVMKSGDLVRWQALGDALGGLPSWASGGNTWAPEVMRTGAGYVLYYTARHTESGRQCIGAAVAQKPEGPFKDSSSKPLVCQLDQGGSIDASPFVDANGTRYLYWKNDGNCCNQATALWGQKLSNDGLSLLGQPVDLLYNGALWEGNLIEAPSMYQRNGKYYLFYSASDYNSDLYGVGYALGFSPLGPFKKQSKQDPWLASKGQVAGPGGQGVVRDGAGQTWLSYHAWTAGQVGYNNGSGGVRSLRLDRLDWKDGVPVLRGPSTTPQAAPVKPKG